MYVCDRLLIWWTVFSLRQNQYFMAKKKQETPEPLTPMDKLAKLSAQVMVEAFYADPEGFMKKLKKWRQEDADRRAEMGLPPKD